MATYIVLLGPPGVGKGTQAAMLAGKTNLPHISSEYFRMPLHEGMKDQGIEITQDKWFTNLSNVGNIGCVSIYLMLDELFHSGKLKSGDKVLCFIPESSRFSYAHMLLTVC